MQKSSRIYVAGHRGLAGSATVRQLQSRGYTQLITRTHDQLDLTDQTAVRAFFERERPEYVFLAAARVGGIHANNTYPAEFIYQNLAIELNVIDCAWRTGAKKLMFLGSSCIYPKFAPQPMKEEHLLTGTLEPTNEPYAIAKIAGIKMCASYNRQYGTNFLAVMPTNLYGPADNYHPMNSHVIPALIRRVHEAKLAGAKEVVVWGTGQPRREFLYSDDLADACIHLMEAHDAKTVGEFVNVGTGTDMTIRELAETVRDVVGFQGEMVFDTTKPDGAPRKLLDVSRLLALGWKPRVGFREGMRVAYEDFVAREAVAA
ncbi:MAG: GDP-L-fucose synthase [Burkholderiales bacterium]